MVNARLNMICGNCGCSDMFSFRIDMYAKDISDEEEKYEPDVYIKCKNCSTVHNLSKYADLEKICPLIGEDCDRHGDQIGDLMCDDCKYI